jgi:hypothetical protein
MQLFPLWLTNVFVSSSHLSSAANVSVQRQETGQVHIAVHHPFLSAGFRAVNDFRCNPAVS